MYRRRFFSFFFCTRSATHGDLWRVRSMLLVVLLRTPTIKGRSYRTQKKSRIVT